MTLETLAGWSALVAAAATVVGLGFLLLFFSRGDPWGILNDLASMVLMLATIPVAIAIAAMTPDRAPANAVAAAVGVAGMTGVTVAQGLLVARRWTYRELLPWTLGFGAVVGAWYLLVGLLGVPTAAGTELSVLAVAAGAGFLATGVGFWVGDQRHPLSVAGGLMLFLASTAFLAWLGILLVSGDAAIPVAAS